MRVSLHLIFFEIEFHCTRTGGGRPHHPLGSNDVLQAYIAANKKFADRVVELLAPEDDFVWAQDYHLLLLPTLLRKRFHTVGLGGFVVGTF